MKFFLPLFGIFTVFSIVESFGTRVHYIIGQVVQDRLDFIVKKNIQSCKYLDEKYDKYSFANASTWPDRVKYSKKFLWTRPLHYFDVDNDPPNYCGVLSYPIEKSEKLKGDSLYSFIEYILNKVHKDSNVKCKLKSFEFKIFLHLLQDLHQPLHLTGKKRGGNQQIIDIVDKSYNLHSFWDSVLYDILMDSLKLNEFKNQLAFWNMILEKDTYKCPKKVDMDLFIKWGNEISKLNCNLIWNYNNVNYVYNSKKLLIDLIKKTIQRSVCVLEAFF